MLGKAKNAIKSDGSASSSSARAADQTKVAAHTATGTASSLSSSAPFVEDNTLAPSSVINKIKLQQQLIAEEIAKGHALEKHIVSGGEFPGWIRTREQLKKHIENVLVDPNSLSKAGASGKTIYYQPSSNTIVIYNPNSIDGGTVFQPTGMLEYFKKVK